MEAAVEQLPDHSSTENVKLIEVDYETSIQDDLNAKSNGVAHSVNVVRSELGSVDLPTGKLDANGVESTTEAVVEDNAEEKCNIDTTPSSAIKSAQEVGETDAVTAGVESVNTTCASKTSADAGIVENQEQMDATSTDVVQQLEVAPVTKDIQDKISHVDEVENEEVVIETPEPDTYGGDNVRFETEVVVETNDAEVEKGDSKKQVSQNILNEMNPNIELNEVLQSSDVTDNVENNNCSIRQEMFNKEELLDILEGNDVQCTEQSVQEVLQANQNDNDNKRNESDIALEQLTRLKKSRRNRNSEIDKYIQTHSQRKKNKTKKVEETSKDVSIVNALVKDWEDDIDEGDPLTEKDVSSNSTEQLSESTASVVKAEKRSSVDSSTDGDGLNSSVNKSADDGQPQRRLGRVIKKKVIFDPDNPDTFTKGKAYIKRIEPQIDKDQPPTKKGKIEPMAQRPKSKSPVSKMQWKKPSSKNSKQNKRLTEVDKLLMDEGAVNMIYQLTPEAPKGRKNMKTKAEFIKKLQSSTPESKEMKFRERKKECKTEDGEPKKILSGKHRTSLSSSVKSPSVCEDFETHSADDSIIYRRHSSSSYSSSCMSPRRLSDVEASVYQNANVSQMSNDSKSQVDADSNHVGDGDCQATPSKEVINKDDCLSIKKKLNSKLSLALNKRKKDSIKIEKPLKKQMKLNEFQPQTQTDHFKFLTIKFNQRVAEICIASAKTKLNIEIMKEMIKALSYVDLRTDTTVTLLTSENGMLCSQLDLTPVLQNVTEERSQVANEIAETIRSLLWAVGQHSKLLCAVSSGVCAGVALAMVGLADISVAADGATFAAAHHGAAPLECGITAVFTSYRQLPQSLLSDLVIFGRRLSSTDALQSGLISRVLCSQGFSAQLQAVIRDIASEPMETVLMKKKLLRLRKPSDAVFLSCLETEKSLMVKYWTSEDGQRAIRASMLNE